MSDLDHTHVLKKPCKGCPFAKATPSGETGGSEVPVYLGQARGPFILNCHNATDMDKEGWVEDLIKVPQCAGAAMFRNVMGWDVDLPAVLQRLESDGSVWDNPEDFMVHHFFETFEVPLELHGRITELYKRLVVKRYLEMHTIDELLEREMLRAKQGIPHQQSAGKPREFWFKNEGGE